MSLGYMEIKLNRHYFELKDFVKKVCKPHEVSFGQVVGMSGPALLTKRYQENCNNPSQKLGEALLEMLLCHLLSFLYSLQPSKCRQDKISIAFHCYQTLLIATLLESLLCNEIDISIIYLMRQELSFSIIFMYVETWALKNIPFNKKMKSRVGIFNFFSLNLYQNFI